MSKREEFTRPRGCFPDIDLDDTWSSRDELPTEDPIGDEYVESDADRTHREICTRLKYTTTTRISEENKTNAGLFPDKYYKDQAKYHKSLRDRGMDNTNKYFGNTPEPKTCCDNQDKYENVISKALKFYSCRNCGADLGDIK